MKSRTLAQAVIETGYVRVDGKRVAKPSVNARIGSTIAAPASRQGSSPARPVAGRAPRPGFRSAGLLRRAKN
ncbi:MAG: S4 domain-containing protein [Sphingomicrobium sp.]